MSLARKVKELREQQKLTQGQLAEYSGLKRSYVSLLEGGLIKKPSAERMLKLARALHVEPEVLYEAAGYAVPTRISLELEGLEPSLRRYLHKVARMPKRDQRLIANLIKTYIERDEEMETQ